MKQVLNAVFLHFYAVLRYSNESFWKFNRSSKTLSFNYEFSLVSSNARQKTTELFYTLHSDKAWIVSQSEWVQLILYLINTIKEKHG